MPPSNNEDLQAVRITEAGSFERISLDRNKVLDSLYRAIGCRYVEVIQVTETISIWVDEEGLRRRPTPNYLATLLAAELGFGHTRRSSAWLSSQEAPTAKETPCHLVTGIFASVGTSPNASSLMSGVLDRK